MADAEHNYKNAEHPIDHEALKEAAEQGRDRIAEQLEHKTPEARAEKNAAELSHEAHEKAISRHEQEPSRHHEASVDTKERRPKTLASTRQQAEAFSNMMDGARSHMSPSSRAFSKVIHNPVVEKTSEVVGNTIARPNAILSGSIGAFVLVLGVFLIARHYGYPLSGAETIVAFAAGWLIGMIYDFLRTMITGGR